MEMYIEDLIIDTNLNPTQCNDNIIVVDTDLPTSSDLSKIDLNNSEGETEDKAPSEYCYQDPPNAMEINGTGTGGERYSNEEKIRIVQLFAKNANACDVQRIFKNEFRKKPPSTKTIRTLYKKFKETGSITRRPYSQRVRPKSNDESITRVKDFFRKNPGLSTRQAAKMLDLSRSTVGKIIQALKGREGGQIKRSRIMKKYAGADPKMSEGIDTACVNSTTSQIPKRTVKRNNNETRPRSVLGSIMFCIDFAAHKHRSQSDSEGSPFINYPIGVANILVQEAGIEDLEIIEAALLQHTTDDTLTSLDYLSSNFSQKVASIVRELIADKRIPKEHRQKYEIQNAPKKSYAAQLIGMADKIYELREIVKCLPQGWNDLVQYEYFVRTKQIVQHYYSANFAMASLLQSFFNEQKV